MMKLYWTLLSAIKTNRVTVNMWNENDKYPHLFQYGSTLLLEAVSVGCVSIVQALIKAKAEVQATNEVNKFIAPFRSNYQSDYYWELLHWNIIKRILLSLVLKEMVDFSCHMNVFSIWALALAPVWTGVMSSSLIIRDKIRLVWQGWLHDMIPRQIKGLMSFWKVLSSWYWRLYYVFVNNFITPVHFWRWHRGENCFCHAVSCCLHVIMFARMAAQHFI